MGNLKDTKKFKIGDEVYTLQQVPASWYLDTVDKSRDKGGVLQNALYMEKIITNVVVSPRVKIDDFTGRINVMRKLLKECEKFILGEELDVIEEEEKNELQPENEE